MTATTPPAPLGLAVGHATCVLHSTKKAQASSPSVGNCATSCGWPAVVTYQHVHYYSEAWRRTRAEDAVIAYEADGGGCMAGTATRRTARENDEGG